MPPKPTNGPVNKDAARMREQRARLKAAGLRTDGKRRVADGPPWQPTAAMRAHIRTMAGYEMTFEYMVNEMRLLQEAGEIPKNRRINRRFIENHFAHELKTGVQSMVMRAAQSMEKQAVGFKIKKIMRVWSPEAKKTVDAIAEVDVAPSFNATEFLLMTKGGPAWQPPAKAANNANSLFKPPEDKLPPIPEKIEIQWVPSPRKDDVS